MSTNESIANAGFSAIIRNNVLLPIVNYCATTPGPYTVEQFASVLKLVSVSPASSISTLSAPNTIPSGLSTTLSNNTFPAPTGYPPIANAPPSLAAFGNMAMPIANTSAKKGRGGKTATPSAPVPDHERCRYIVTRGRSKGGRCEARAEPGQPFCKGCDSKKASKAQLQSEGPTGTTGVSFSNTQGSLSGIPTVPGIQSFSVPTMPGMSGMPGMLPSMAPNSLNQLNSNMSNSLTATQPEIKLQVNQLGNGLYHERNNNLLIKITGPNEYLCCGLFDPKTRIPSPLTLDKIEICKQLGMSYVDSSKSDIDSLTSLLNPTTVNATGQTLPSVNQQLPGILTGANNVAAVNMNAFSGALPSVVTPSPQMQQFSLPQMPGLSGIGTNTLVPGITDYLSPDDPADDEEDDEDDS